jgi:hypothetical protein
MNAKSRPVVVLSTGRPAVFIQSFEELLLEAQPERSRDNLGIRADSRRAQAIGLGCDCRRQNVEIARFSKNAHFAIAVPSSEPVRQPTADAPSALVA